MVRPANKRVRWGVLSTASIGVTKVIPAMQKGEHSVITAICSRGLEKAQQAALKFGIEKAYGSYEELLADPEIDAIYNPTPNHLHVPWTHRAAEAGKHVLCEKPIALSAEEAKEIVAVRDRMGVKIGEAFMVLTYPQWLRTRDLIREGRIGDLRLVTGVFSYFDISPDGIHNHVELGGGGLLDIGCYMTLAARFAYGEMPKRVVSTIDRDPQTKVDRLTSALMDFTRGQASFTCSTQMAHYQRVHFFGTKGRIEIEIPFNAPPDRPTRIFIDTEGDLPGNSIVIEEFPTEDQYTLQGDAFSLAILENTEVPVPLEQAIDNMSVIDAIFRSAKSGRWEKP